MPVKRKGFFTRIGETIRGEPREVTMARQRSFQRERQKQASIVGRRKAQLQAEAQVRRERERLNPPRRKAGGHGFLGFGDMGNVPVRTSRRAVRRRPQRRVYGRPRYRPRRRRVQRQRDSGYFDVIGGF